MNKSITPIIPLNAAHRNAAIRLSGGPDSAIIYYVLCDFYKNDTIKKLHPKVDS